MPSITDLTWLSNSQKIKSIFEKIHSENRDPVAKRRFREEQRRLTRLRGNISEPEVAELDFEAGSRLIRKEDRGIVYHPETFLTKYISLFKEQGEEQVWPLLAQAWVEGYFEFIQKSMKIRLLPYCEKRGLRGSMFPMKDDFEFFEGYECLENTFNYLDDLGSFQQVYFDFLNHNFSDSGVVIMFQKYQMEMVEKKVFLASILAYLKDCRLDDMSLKVFKPLFSTRDFVRFCYSVKTETHPLIQKGLWEQEQDRFDASTRIKLSAEALNALFDFEPLNQKPKNDAYDLVFPSEVMPQPMYFDDQTERQIGRLHLLLSQTPRSEWGKFTCLFEGSSGAGKTMLARELFKRLDLPFLEIKSLHRSYVGQTEALIRRIFNLEYPKLYQQYGGIGILINEFDQLASKKNTVRNSNDTFTNAIVSQLLNSMDGMQQCLMICTINESKEKVEPSILRRFKFSIRFGIPDQKTREKIWMSQAGIWQEDALLLKELIQHPFSGADIVNVAQKAALLKFLGITQAKELLQELVMEQEEIAEKSRYDFDNLEQNRTIGFVQTNK